ncbi:Protein NRT1/ PTR FAMILY 6.3 [Bienertia sinuspersici]
MDMEFGKGTVSDAWDYKGRPADRSKTGGWQSAAMILGGEACERLTTLGIAVNLVTYLTGVMHLGNAASANTVTNFMGTSFMLCLLGGCDGADHINHNPESATTKMRRGIGFMHSGIGNAAGVLYLALYLTALGTGGVKASVSGRKDTHDKVLQLVLFLHKFGSLAAVTILVYIQDNMGRQWGMTIPFQEACGQSLTQIAAVFVAAWRKRHMDLPSDSSLLFNIDDLADGGKHKKQQCLIPSNTGFWTGQQ